MVEARTFCIYTDHRPITFAFTTPRDKCSPRQFRYLDFISQFSTYIRYVAGKDNIVADTLSRVEEVVTILDYRRLAQAQENDEELQTLLMGGCNLQLEKVAMPGTITKVYCDISASNPRPYVTHNFSPEGFRLTAASVIQK